MEKDNLITVEVLARVQGPGGIKLIPGKVVALEDSPYVRLLVKSGNVLLVDPPSLDPEFLKGIGFGSTEVSVPEVKEEAVVPEGFLTRAPKVKPQTVPNVPNSVNPAPVTKVESSTKEAEVERSTKETEVEK